MKFVGRSKAIKGNGNGETGKLGNGSSYALRGSGVTRDIGKWKNKKINRKWEIQKTCLSYPVSRLDFEYEIGIHSNNRSIA
jgi:hypothetical protein